MNTSNNSVSISSLLVLVGLMFLTQIFVSLSNSGENVEFGGGNGNGSTPELNSAALAGSRAGEIAPTDIPVQRYIPAAMKQSTSNPQADFAIAAPVDKESDPFLQQEDGMQAVARQVERDLGDFIRSLEGDERRRREVRDALVLAYQEIAEITVQANLGIISADELESGGDPQHVLTRASTLLNSAELVALEANLQANARRRFDFDLAPQADSIAADLTDGNREFLLDTLFQETNRRTNPNSIGPSVKLDESLQQQIDAISSTRNTLRDYMDAEQYASANAFLAEQERGLETAKAIFTQ